MTQQEDTALIAGQLADLTEAVNDMAGQLDSIRNARTPSKSGSTLPRAS
jgi:hypothetical protein